MARPNNAAAIAGRVQGLREAKAAFQAMPEVFRDNTNDATFVTLSEIKRNARARLQASPSIRTRNLYNAVDFTLNRKSGRGRVGIAMVTSTVNARPGVRKNVKVRGIVIAGKGGGAQGGRLDRPSRRAHFIEFGTRRQPAEPFMIPATEGEEQHFLNRVRDAGRQSEKDLANIGSRNL